MRDPFGAGSPSAIRSTDALDLLSTACAFSLAAHGTLDVSSVAQALFGTLVFLAVS
jgi:hypothetical protein